MYYATGITKDSSSVHAYEMETEIDGEYALVCFNLDYTETISKECGEVCGVTKSWEDSDIQIDEVEILSVTDEDGEPLNSYDKSALEASVVKFSYENLEF